MKNIFSNRWIQGGIAAAAVAIAFFAYQSTSAEEAQTEATAKVTEASEESNATIEAANVSSENGEETKSENTVNNTPEADMINSANEEETK